VHRSVDRLAQLHMALGDSAPSVDVAPIDSTPSSPDSTLAFVNNDVLITHLLESLGWCLEEAS
jgi:hypothetical protein